MSTFKGYRDLIVYKKAFSLAMKIFNVTKAFPQEEKYSLVDQIRRSSRSVCSCIAEAYRKRKYQNYFINKISDADGENSEVLVWLEFSSSCGYLSQEKFTELEADVEEIGRMLFSMMENSEKFLPKEKQII